LFNPIRIQSHKVTSDGNPIEFELSNAYTVKGINKEETITSVVRIHVGEDGKIEKVEDKWNGSLPEGAVSEVSISISDVSECWSGTLTWPQAFRKLNAVTVPVIVKVPKTEEEDVKMRESREAARLN